MQPHLGSEQRKGEGKGREENNQILLLSTKQNFLGYILLNIISILPDCCECHYMDTINFQ